MPKKNKPYTHQHAEESGWLWECPKCHRYNMEHHKPYAGDRTPLECDSCAWSGTIK